MTEPSTLRSIKDSIIDKFVHSSDGVIIGNIQDIDNDSVLVKGDMVSIVYYNIPIQKVKEWDGHALWLTIDAKESKIHILTSQSRLTTNWTSPIDLELDEDILNQIAIEAERYGVSQSNYINQIIKRYLEWDNFETKAGEVMPISKPVAKKLFDSLTEEQVISMAKKMAKNSWQNILAEFERKQEQQREQTEGGEEEKEKEHITDMNLFLSWLENDMNSNAIEIRHIVHKRKEDGNNITSHSKNCEANRRSPYQQHHRCILKHDIGYAYSLYYKTVLDSIFDKILQNDAFIKITSAMLIVEFEGEVLSN
jgi:hypothetical protein